MHINRRLQNIVKICLLVLGIVFFVIGLGLLMAVPVIVTREVAKQDYLGRDENGTDNLVLKSFRNPEYALFLDIWTFSVQNAAQVVGGAKPVVVEKGPYVFVETQAKNFLEFSHNDTRVLYRNTRTYHYSQQLSCDNCSLGDKVVVPNLIFQKLVDIALQSEAKRFAIEEVLKLKGESAFINVAVGELLFDGYKDPIVSSICDHFLMRSICASAGIPDRVGLLYKQNNTDDGLYEINAGVDSVYNLGKLYSWNNMSVLPSTSWYGPQARIVKGSDGQLFPPNLFLTKNLEIFVGKISRSLEMEQSGYAEVDGLPAFKYIPAKSMNSVAIQRAKGFCNPASPRFFNDTNVQEEGCSPAGLMDVSSVVPGNPRIYISQPRFYNSPKQLGESIVGMAEPSQENDQTFFNIEPLTGVIVSAAGRSQLNVGVIKGNLRAFANMKDLIVPMVWMNESALIDAGTKAQVMRAVSAIHLTFVWGVLLIALAALLVLIFAGVVVLGKYINKTPQNPAYDPLANDSDSISSNIHPTPVAFQPETYAQTPAVLQPVPQL